MAGLLTPDPEFFNPFPAKASGLLKNLPDTAAGPCRSFTCFPFHLTRKTACNPSNAGTRDPSGNAEYIVEYNAAIAAMSSRVRHHNALYVVAYIIPYTIYSVNWIFQFGNLNLEISIDTETGSRQKTAGILSLWHFIPLF